MDLRLKYPSVPLSTWLKVSKLPRSSFYEWKRKISIERKTHCDLTATIKRIVEDSKNSYGYRRVNLALKTKGYKVNHKRVYRIMKELGLLCTKFSRRGRKYVSYKGEVGKIADNHLNRNFHSKRKNEVWVTDVSEFKVKDRKIYLSPIMDLYNSEIVSYNLSTSPTVEFALKPLKEAIAKTSNKNNLMIHSDQGFHYQNHLWVRQLEKHNIKQSMSRKGNCLDNSPIENFFAILKQEMYYGNKFKSTQELSQRIEEYIYWYNHHRIKAKLKGLSPVDYGRETLITTI